MGGLKKTSTIENIIYQSAYQLLTLLLPLVTVPIVSRALGATLIGQYNYATSIENYFCLFSALGINFLGTREIGKCGDDKNKRTNVFWNIYYVKIIFSLFLIIVYFFVFCSSFSSLSSKIFVILLLDFLGQILDISWLFFGIENFRVTVLKNTLIKIGTFLLIILFVTDKSDFYLYVFIMSGCVLACNFILWINAKKIIGFKHFSYKESMPYVKPMLILFIPGIAASMYVYMDKIILGVICDKAEVGYYASMEKIVSIPFSFVTAVTTVLYSKSVKLISNQNDEKCSELLSKSLMSLFVILVPFCFGLLSVADVFVPVFFGDGYEPVKSLLKVGTLYLVFRSVRAVIKLQVMLPRSMDKEFALSIMAGGVSNVILDVILVHVFNSMGAVIATIISDAVSMGMCLFFSRKYIKVNVDFLKNLAFVLFGIIMYFSIALMNNFIHTTPLLTLIVDVIAGGSVYILLTFSFWWAVTKGKISECLDIRKK